MHIRWNINIPKNASTNVNDTLAVVKVELCHIRVENIDICTQLTDLQLKLYPFRTTVTISSITNCLLCRDLM